MKFYRLNCVVQGPEDTDEEKYLAEAPDLPGCRAWGNTAAEALENLQSAVAAFIESHQDRGEKLSAAVRKSVREESPDAVSELLVAV
jgi:predicted RNase H-like HicB family nuclease